MLVSFLLYDLYETISVIESGDKVQGETLDSLAALLSITVDVVMVPETQDLA